MLLLFRKFSLSILLLIALNGCDGKDTWCFTTAPNAYDSPDNITNVTNTVVEVNASGIDPNNAGAGINQWVSSGINVTQGDAVSLSASGTIILSTPYGLSSSVASGDSIATESGNPQDQAAMQAYNDMITGQPYESYYANNGLGMLYNIQANATGPTPITVDGTFSGAAFPFTLNQVITISTADCTSGTTNKWTWDNGWIYTAVRCDYEGHNRNFSTSDSPSDIQCKAIHRCDTQTLDIDDQYKGWRCHLNAQINTDYTTVSDSDSCSSSSGGYNCEYNAANTTTACYASTGWNRDNGGSGDYCNGSHKDGNNITVSENYPGCSSESSTANVTTPSLNSCGTTDTCWNTNGYRLYAIQGDASGTCPATLDSNCIHLNQSAVSQGGKSFPAAGGQVNVQIIDPNAAPIVPSSVVTDDQNQINANNAEITTLTNTNTTLSANLITNLGSVNNFAGLDCSQIAYLQTTAVNYQELIPSSAMNTSGTASVDSILSSISSALVTLNNNCNSFTSYVAPSYVPNPSTSTPWLTTLSTINASLPNIITLVTNLGSPALPDGCEVSSANLATYQATLLSVLTSLQTYSTTNTFDGTLPALRLAVPTSSGSTQTTLNNIVNAMKTLQLTINNGNTNLTDYANDCFNKQISLGYVEQDPDAVDVNGNPLPPSWDAYLTTPSTGINAQISSLQVLVNSLGSSSYQTSLNTMITNLKSAITTATNTYNSIFANTYSAVSDGGDCSTTPASISSLNNCNSYLQSQILNAQNNSGSAAIGGYQVYIKSDPILASNGANLQAVISQCNLNVSPCGYDNDLGEVTATITTSNMPSSGTIWLKVNDPDNNYNNNMGSYEVSIGQTSITNSFGGLFSDVVNLIRNGVSTMSRTMFENITCSSGVISNESACHDYLTSIKIILNLYMIIFGMMFLFGLIQIDYVDFCVRVIKIALIITLIQPDSFDFFNQYFFSGVLDFSNFFFLAATGAPLDNPFAFLNQSIAMLMFDPVTYIKLISFSFQGMIGIVMLILLAFAVFDFLKAVYRAFEVYIMSFIGLAICFAVAPIFLIFLLFKTTQSLFSNWFSAIVRFVLEPVILFVGLIILNAMLISLIQQLFNFSVCFKCTFAFTFSIPGLFSTGSDSLFCIPFFSPWGVDNVGSGTPFTLFTSIPTAITFAIVTKVMNIYSKRMSKEMTSAILGEGLLFGGHKGGKEPTMGINPFSDAASKMKKLTGNTKEDKARRAEMKQESLDKHKSNASQADPATKDSSAATTKPTPQEQKKNVVSAIQKLAASGDMKAGLKPRGGIDSGREASINRAAAAQTKPTNNMLQGAIGNLRKTEGGDGREVSMGRATERAAAARATSNNMLQSARGNLRTTGVDGREASMGRAAAAQEQSNNMLQSARGNLRKTGVDGRTNSMNRSNMVGELQGKINQGVTSDLRSTGIDGREASKAVAQTSSLEGLKTQKMVMDPGAHGSIDMSNRSAAHTSVMSEIKMDPPKLKKVTVDGREESQNKSDARIAEDTKKVNESLAESQSITSSNRSGGHNPVARKPSDIATAATEESKNNTPAQKDSAAKATTPAAEAKPNTTATEKPAEKPAIPAARKPTEQSSTSAKKGAANKTTAPATDKPTEKATAPAAEAKPNTAATEKPAEKATAPAAEAKQNTAATEKPAEKPNNPVKQNPLERTKKTPAYKKNAAEGAPAPAPEKASAPAVAPEAKPSTPAPAAPAPEAKLSAPATAPAPEAKPSAPAPAAPAPEAKPSAPAPAAAPEAKPSAPAPATAAPEAKLSAPAPATAAPEAKLSAPAPAAPEKPKA